MADILIRMEMPTKKNGAILIIYPNGKCAFEDGQQYEAVELPEHGDLIDRDALEDTGADVYVVYDDNGVDEDYAFSHAAILNAPVIVPASKEDD